MSSCWGEKRELRTWEEVVVLDKLPFFFSWGEDRDPFRAGGSGDRGGDSVESRRLFLNMGTKEFEEKGSNFRRFWLINMSKALAPLKKKFFLFRKLNLIKIFGSHHEKIFFFLSSSKKKIISCFEFFFSISYLNESSSICAYLSSSLSSSSMFMPEISSAFLLDAFLHLNLYCYWCCYRRCLLYLLKLLTVCRLHNKGLGIWVVQSKERCRRLLESLLFSVWSIRHGTFSSRKSTFCTFLGLKMLIKII